MKAPARRGSCPVFFRRRRPDSSGARWIPCRQKYKRDFPARRVSRSGPPEVLLRRFLGIDLRDPRLVTDAVRLLRAKVEMLEDEYAG